MVGACLGLQISGGEFPVAGILQHGIIFQFELSTRRANRIAEYRIAGNGKRLCAERSEQHEGKNQTHKVHIGINPSTWPESRG